MIKAVIFDVGRVILPIDWSRVIEHLGISEQRGQQLGALVAEGEHYDRYERGGMSTEDFFLGFESEYKLCHDIEVIRQAWMRLILPPFMGVDEVLKHLKQKTEVYALSNTNQAHSEHFMREFEVFAHFHEVFTSHALKSRKPEPEIFQKVLSLIGRRPEETLFFDDMPENIDAAKALGMNAELVKNSVDQIKTVLKKHGLWA